MAPQRTCWVYTCVYIYIYIFNVVSRKALYKNCCGLEGYRFRGLMKSLIIRAATQSQPDVDLPHPISLGLQVHEYCLHWTHGPYSLWITPTWGNLDLQGKAQSFKLVTLREAKLSQ